MSVLSASGVTESDLLAAIDELTAANREHPDPALEYRLVSTRHRAFDLLDRVSAISAWPARTREPAEPASGRIPELTASELTADVLRAHIVTDGCVLVRGLADPATVSELIEGIDHALGEWGSLRRPYAKPTGSPWFDPLTVDADENAALGRTWVTNSGGLLTADSPRVMFRLFEMLEATGLRRVVHEYLGERPALSANKCTLRRVPVATDAGWHQDGAFLGRDIRALNIWLALTPCGRDAPGLDVVPRRFDEIVETGTHGSYFDWAVGSDLVESLARETAVVRPEFEAGDALLFDDLLLHRTATEPTMTHHRDAIETWCFAPSAYPQGHVPIVW